MTNSGSSERSNRFFSDDELKQSEEAYFVSSGHQIAENSKAAPEPGRKQSFFDTLKKHQKLFIVLAAVFAALIVAVVLILSNRHVIVKDLMKSELAANIADEMIGESYNKNVLDKQFDRSKVVINEGVTEPEGYRSIAIFGIDARDSDLRSGSRSDSMMVLSVNEETNELQIGSVFRDTYLVDDCNERNEYYIGKANAAYVIGGPELALSMLNRNWDLALTDYVVVNFGGLSNIIDAMGGIELEVTKAEVKEINYHMKGQIDAFGGKYKKLKGHGKMLLNGAQATTFCRIRSVDFKNPLDGQTYTIDYGRTARQRYTLNELFKQAKEKGVSTLISVINKVCDNNVGDNKFIMTSLPLEDLLQLLGDFMDMTIAGQDAFPHTDKAYITMLDSGSTIVAHTLAENTAMLHEFLYGQKNYKGSAAFLLYETWITRWVNTQKTGNPDVMFDPTNDTGETLAAIDSEDDFNYEDFTYQYISEETEPETGRNEETGAPETVVTEAPTEAPTEAYTEPSTEETPSENETQTEETEPETEPPSEDTGGGEDPGVESDDLEG